MIQVPRLAKGHGHKGPEFYGCCNTGMAPTIFHSRCGKYYVGPELRCRDAMRAGIGYVAKVRTIGEGRQKVWLFKGRAGAVRKFMILCGAVLVENSEMARRHDETRQKAARGDLAAALSLGDF